MGEKAREKAGEKERERWRARRGEEDEEGEGEGEEEEGEEEESYDAWGGNVPWGVPTYPGAWTANLQLTCGSGQRGKVYFRLFLDNFFGDGAVLVSIFRKAAL
jgi:hypothetical protein